MSNLFESAPGVAAKLSRAIEHLAALDALALAYMISDPTRFDVIPDRATNSYTVTAQIVAPPIELAVVFGDALHNLRSSLDHLARLLVLADGKSPIDRGHRATAFPILLTAPKDPIDIAPGLKGEARVLLEEVQPYRSDAPAEHPLWRLHELNNVDKHRLLNITALSGAGGVAFVPAPLDPTIPTTQEQRRHKVQLIPGVPQRFDVAAEEMHDPAAMVGMWSYTVVLGEPGIGWRQQLVGTGLGIGNYITEQVIPRFVSLLASPTAS